ncbi:hypothetical protein RQN30_10660 [Arcanobacterium hippocoleae]
MVPKNELNFIYDLIALGVFAVFVFVGGVVVGFLFKAAPGEISLVTSFFIFATAFLLGQRVKERELKESKRSDS